MSDYDFILDSMTWSFSRIEMFERCACAFYLNYILKKKSSSGFFGEYGSFGHSLLEKYFKNELLSFELEDEFVDKFTANVPTPAPPMKNVDLAAKYFEQGKDYFAKFDGLYDCEILGVEKDYKFKIGKYDFTGIIDLELKNKDNQYGILDHKSKSKQDKKKLTKKDDPNEYVQLIDGRYIPFHLAKQLYVYSIPFKENYGEYPKLLTWNMFRIGDWYELEFNEDDLKRSIKWVEEVISKIYQETKWLKGEDTSSFWCDFVCSSNVYCKYSSRYIDLGE